MTVYATLPQLVEQELAETIGAGYDLDELARKMCADGLIEITSQGGFVLVTDGTGTPPGFWDLVKECALKAQPVTVVAGHMPHWTPGGDAPRECINYDTWTTHWINHGRTDGEQLP